MLIICIIIALFVYAGIFATGFILLRNAIDERRKRNFANLPNEVLMTHVLLSPVYVTQYRNAITCMSKKRAEELVIRCMLTDMGIIGYRKSWV